MTSGRELVGATADSIARPGMSSRVGWFHRESVPGFVWIAPAFLYLAFFIAYPFFMSIYLSVSSARVGSPDSHFVGLQNYTRLFADPTFWQTVKPLEQDAEYHFTTGYPGPLTPAADEVYQQFIMVDALAQFATDKMDLEQTVKWADEKIKAIYAKFA